MELEKEVRYNWYRSLRKFLWLFLRTHIWAYCILEQFYISDKNGSMLALLSILYSGVNGSCPHRFKQIKDRLTILEMENKNLMIRKIITFAFVYKMQANVKKIKHFRLIATTIFYVNILSVNSNFRTIDLFMYS